MARAYLTRRRGGGERSLKQIVKKVGTPRRRCPKHQAQRAVSGIQRRLHPSRCATTAWQVRRERRTATARHPYLFGKGRVARSLKQIVKKVGTPRRRCPKHQARRAVSGIQRRLRRVRRTATARHPYLIGKGRVARSLKQIVKKVGTPRRRGPKHQAQRAVSGIQRRLRRERRTALARHPYLFLELVCIEVIVSLQLDFAAQKKGGMAVPAVRRLVYFLAPCPLEPSSRQQHTGETRCAPLLKSKSKRLLVLVGIWDDFRRPLFDVGESPFFLLGFG